ncbi:MAG: N-6 DNA methylase [Bacteroidetes bacterium]|nr:N-6 DNA methylase [Bacteroidota bacterium]
MTKSKTFLDPCCGTGSFLLSAARRKEIKAENLVGFDTDEHAVFLAKINLLLHYTSFIDEPKIYCIDSLRLVDAKAFFQSIGIKKVDAIATNPPWGACKNGDFPEELEQLTASKEIFSMFIARSLELIRDKGECAFLLPESILNIQSHKGIRGLISTKTTITQIKEHGRIFTGVFTPVISMHFKKQVPKRKTALQSASMGKREKSSITIPKCEGSFV